MSHNPPGAEVLVWALCTRPSPQVGPPAKSPESCAGSQYVCSAPPAASPCACIDSSQLRPQVPVSPVETLALWVCIPRGEASEGLQRPNTTPSVSLLPFASGLPALIPIERLVANTATPPPCAEGEVSSLLQEHILASGRHLA